MNSSIHIGGVGQHFDALYHRLSRNQANALLNDCVYELSASWKFFTALAPGLPILVVLHGFSGVPLAFARHLSRVDILGFNHEEEELFQELAHFNQLSNCRICRAPQDLQGQYGLILWLPTRRAITERHEEEWLLRALSQLHPQGELWLMLCYKPGWADPMNRLRRIVRRIKSSDHEPLPQSIRLLPLNEPIPHQSALHLLQKKISARQEGPRALQQMESFGISPEWLAPSLVAPFPSSPTPPESGSAFRDLESKKLFETKHILTRFSAARSSSFIQRLLAKIEQKEPGSRLQPGNYRVLPGGKVQIDARWKKRHGEQSLFIKLPLVPFAEARLQKQSDMLNFLQRQETHIRQLDAASTAFASKVFPQILAQGMFETQTYFIESRVKGVPLSRLQVPHETLPKVCAALFSFWHHVQTCCGEAVKVDEGQFAQLFQQPLLNLIQWAKPPQKYAEILQRLEAFFGKHVLGQQLFLSLGHGDFSTKNILAKPQGYALSGIIDWDMATRRAMPLLDVLHFFVRLDASSFREAPPKIALRLVQPDSRALHWTNLQNALNKFGYDGKILPVLVAYYWMQRLQVYLDSPKHLDTQFMQRHFYDILDFFREHLLS